MSLAYKTSHLTKSWVIVLFCALIVIGLIITLVLVGDVNLLNQHWLVPHGGIYWHGLLNDANKDDVLKIYTDAGNDPSTFDFDKYKGQQIEIYWQYSYVKFIPLILVPTLGAVVLSIVIPLFLKIFKLMEIDTLIFSIMCSLSMNVLIFSGLIPVDEVKQWMWIIRLLITFVVALALFFALNKIINYFISLNPRLAEQALKDISSLERQRNLDNKTLSDLTKTLKDQNKDSSITIDKTTL